MTGVGWLSTGRHHTEYRELDIGENLVLFNL